MAASKVLLALGVCFLVAALTQGVSRRKKQSVIDTVTDPKDFKKLLRTRNNVLVVYSKNADSASSRMDMLEDVAVQMKGLATVVLVDCMEGKKLCKKMKVSPSTVELKHYKDGDFNKDYDRKNTVKSMINFLRDPTGDIPWEEDATAVDVVHVESTQGLSKLLKQEKRPLLLMIYVPWCGYCKKLKPEFAGAATSLKGSYVLAGIDVEKPESMQVRQDYNITGFPTMFYFEKGKLIMKYGGENNKDGIEAWMKDPQPPKEAEKEEEWADTASDVVHLTDATFDDFLDTHGSVLIMFYAPWCGHCKKMKPEYVEAAETLKKEGIEGVVAAVDATKEKAVGDRFKIKGFPTCKYFKDGKEAFDFNERTAEKIVEFMKDPQEPPPPPPPEPAWSEVESDVVHLTDESFKQVLRKKKHALVMFYAPWCGHCKRAKPEYMAAAAKFKDDNKVAYGAVDCTEEKAVCSLHDVTGYPTFKYFNYGKNAQKYTGGREEADFVKFMTDPLNPLSMSPTPPAPEEDWQDVSGHENVHHLSEASFDSFMAQHESVLLMFYAPWCGHCKAMKPAYAEAATLLKEQNEAGVLAAVDATVERNLASKFDIKGFPTLKYFKKGEALLEYESGRATADLVGFMKKPGEKPVAPLADPAWSDEPSAIRHLSGEDFPAFLKEKSSALVMFYAPWCGHCKRAKPDFTAAAESLSVSEEMGLGAVDCTVSAALCSQEDVTGYPTLRYYSKGQFSEEYPGGRSKNDFISYMAGKVTAGKPQVDNSTPKTDEKEEPTKPPLKEEAKKDKPETQAAEKATAKEAKKDEL